MPVRGVRGATVADQNTSESILTETRQLLNEIIEKNNIAHDDIASIFFSMSADLNAEFPAIAARQMGMSDVPLICMTEIPVPNSLPLCIRVLIHWNTDTPPSEIIHPYLKDAVKLRPDKHCAE
ncbi:chorismate mutase [bacterium]|nr:chorismate mutase [bacterium]